MRKQFDEQLRELDLEMVRMGGAVENAISAAVRGLVNRDRELNKRAIEADKDIDDMEKHIESRCLSIILRQQPVAADLRKVSAALKMITDMERIGDHAADISEISLFLDEGVGSSDPADISKMAEDAVKMLTAAINAYVYSDEELARDVIGSDDIVDRHFVRIKKEITEMIANDRNTANYALDLLMIAKYLEKIGDHAQNIAEWVVFSITGVHKDTDLLITKM